ncbi:hypothetical protein [Actinomadura viridis]|uniref:Uncharacterized protein n=1 Tax=Actinomadura viridis TaxID=58110 RepID=A0A931D9B0_9ACTN|nr:hypothetical protein [Actinomadura viridis]MBG6086819.1 hypothetical protein [Actinomadura viridis]
MGAVLFKGGGAVWTAVLWWDLFRDACVTGTLDDRGLLTGALVLLGTDMLARVARFFLPPLVYAAVTRILAVYVRFWLVSADNLRETESGAMSVTASASISSTVSSAVSPSMSAPTCVPVLVNGGPAVWIGKPLCIRICQSC